jgi:hypothetical protein
MLSWKSLFFTGTEVRRGPRSTDFKRWRGPVPTVVSVWVAIAL